MTDNRYYTAQGREDWRQQKVGECLQQLGHLRANRLDLSRQFTSRVLSAINAAKHDEVGQLMSAWGDKGPFSDFNSARRVGAVIENMGF
jgi:hypothetical protein